jgi:hypothetical protein
MRVTRNLFGSALLGLSVGGLLAYGVYRSEFGLMSPLLVFMAMVVLLLLLVPIILAALVDFARGRWRKAVTTFVGIGALCLALFVGRAVPTDVRFALVRQHYLDDLALTGRTRWKIDEDLFGSLNATYLIYDELAKALPPERSESGCSIYAERVDSQFYLETYRC